MKQARYTYGVKTWKSKIIFISMAAIFFVVHLVGAMIRGLEIMSSLLISAIGSLVLLLVMWIYGKRRMFGFEWRLYDTGLQILKNSRQIGFVRWEDVMTFGSDAVIIARDGSKYPIALPPRLEREMRQRMLEIMNEKGIAL